MEIASRGSPHELAHPNPRSASSPAARPSTEITAALAEFATSLQYRALPRHVVERAKDLVLDHLGVALYGSRLPWSTKVRDVVVSERGVAESTIYGARRVPARSAALVNGAAAHAIELDDTHDESLGHPGCVILPAALAVAEALDRSGKDFLAAMVAAYDVQCRVGSALGNDLIRRGFHPTATLGVYGAATAAGHLLRIKPSALISAFGSGASMSSGVMQFTEDPEGTMIKRLHAGLPAERGVLAAKLAAAGFAGPKQAFEGRWGIARVFAAQEDLGRILENLGELFEIERITIKLYPCCKLFHSTIEAIAECRSQRAFVADDVVALEPFGPSNMIDTHMEYRPLSTMAAQYSLPYTCAAAIALDASDPESFSDAALSRKDVLRLADVVKPVVDPELEAVFPRQFAGGMRITLRDGTRLSHTVLDSRSSPSRPIGREDVQAKFLTLTGDILSRARQQRILDEVANLERATSVRQITGLLRGLRPAPIARASRAPRRRDR